MTRLWPKVVAPDAYGVVEHVGVAGQQDPQLGDGEVVSETGGVGGWRARRRGDGDRRSPSPGQAQAEVGDARAGVGVQPCRRPDGARAVGPGSPAQHTRGSGCAAPVCGAVARGVVVARVEVVGHPLPHVAEHVVQAEGVGPAPADG